MSKHILFVLLFVAAAGSASAHVFKSVGADGKIMYSDHPSDRSVSVSVIKADVVQAVPLASAAPAAEASTLRQLVLHALAAGAVAESSGATGKGLAPKQVCDKSVNVVVDSKGELLKILPPKSVLSGFKTK